MLFNSVEFLIFFPLVTIIYFLLPHRFRWFHLLLASCIFYSFFIPVYILILFFTIIVDFFAGILISDASGSKRKLYLTASIIANVGILCVFKYYNFFIDNVSELFKMADIKQQLPYLTIALPIGLSFHTFQAMSYTIEVYRGAQTPERNFGIYALYVMFYPQLVAGPIERPQNLLHQFHENHFFNYEECVYGLRLMLWGYFKKMVIADNCALVVNDIFKNYMHASSLNLFIGISLFAVQIYCDFSGYSDSAIGSAQVMGFKLMRNFAYPYFSRDIAEFWRRWHISLSTWFRDYVYFPLGGSRVNKLLRVRNTMIIFLLSGFWHGANWTFVVWGALNAVYFLPLLLSDRNRQYLDVVAANRSLPTLHDFGKMLITFLLACLAWTFFRAPDVHVAVNYLIRLFSFQGNLKISKTILTPAVFCVVLFVIEWLSRRGMVQVIFTTPNVYRRWAAYVIITMLILLYTPNTASMFIYFQF